MEQIPTQYFWLIICAALWSLPWKGIALWKAAKLNDKWWFAVLLVVNALGLLEILYIFIFSKRKNKHRLTETEASRQNIM